MINLEYIGWTQNQTLYKIYNINLVVEHSFSNESVFIDAEETLWILTSDTGHHPILSIECCNYVSNFVVFRNKN